MNVDFFKDKTILITGNTGFKGSWLSEIMYLAGANVIGYALEPKDESLYNILELEKKITPVYGDIRDFDKVLEIFNKYKPELVIHMAAQPIVLESYEKPRYTFETNIMGIINVLESIRLTDSVKSFVNVTTDKVYFDDQTKANIGFKEDDKLCGYDPYSNSKSCSELVTYSYNESFFRNLDYPRVSTCRAGNVIGGGDFSSNRIVPDCVRAAGANEAIKIRNPYSIRPYQHVLDCLTGYMTVLSKQYNDKSFVGNYNFGPNKEDAYETEKLVKLFCEKWGDLEYINLNENSKKESNYLKLDTTLAHERLGWYRKIDVEKAIEMIVDWTKCYFNKEDIIALTDEQIMNYYNMDRNVVVYEKNKRRG